ncbi:MAG: protein kinase, partial [Ktedonobacteraceae bacterium]|nr:protein kinase [Ktedonobacteraceae bacterium]
MECPYCKTENRDGVNFCGGCGKFIGSAPLTQTSASGNTGQTSTGGTTGGVPRSLTPGARLQGGRYVITKVLGQGGMGAALLATDVRLDSKRVVIKELISENVDPTKLQEDVRNFKREVATLAHIEHPLVPGVTDHFQEGTRYFMVQEYVEGEDLEEQINRTNQPLKERDVLVSASETLDVLHYLSQQTPPIVHRDIKPANIVIGTRDKRAHLVDFGIARAEVVRNAQRKQTSALGTPGYAPPEQYQGNADPRSDIYALGATLHHLLTNRDPRNHPPFTYPPARTLNPQLSIEVEHVLGRALVNDINQRYQSAAAMKQDVDDILFHRFGVTSGNSYTLTSSSGAMPTLPSTIHASGAPTQASGASNTPTVSGTNYSLSNNPTISGTNFPAAGVAPTITGSHTPPTMGTPPPPPPGYTSGPMASYQSSQPSSPSLPPTPIPGSSYPGLPQQPSHPGLPPHQPSHPAQQPSRRGWMILSLVLLLLLILGGIAGALALFRNNTTATTPNGTPIPANGIGVTMINNEPIG